MWQLRARAVERRRRRYCWHHRRRRWVAAAAARSRSATTQCSDGIDNDGDGKIDYNDPECVGPLDNDEGTFATGIPGDNSDACKQDCFFDGNSGMGDDGCEWQLKCDPMTNNADCPYDAAYATVARDRVFAVGVAVG